MNSQLTQLIKWPLGTDIYSAGAGLFLGPFTAPPVLIGMVIVLLIVFVVGRLLIGLALRLVLIALVVVIGLWLLGVIGSGFNLI